MNVACVLMYEIMKIDLELFQFTLGGIFLDMNIYWIFIYFKQ